jgi:hypothetical protein
LSTYKTLDFVSARQKAFEHLSRFFTVRKVDSPANLPLLSESWLVELEITRYDEVICLEVTIALEPDFPLSLPSIYLTKEDIARFGFLPNIDTNGLICTFDPNTNITNPELPELLVEVCVRKAKSIIEDGLNNDNTEKYDKEFIAYWENKYCDETLVDTQVLSLVSETGDLPSRVTYVLLERPIGRFYALLYSDRQQFQVTESYLKRHQITYQEIPTFYLGQLKDWSPPFCLRNADVLKLVESTSLRDEFREYLKSRPLLPIVTFARIIDGRNLIFGWRHNTMVYSRKHRRKKKLSRGKYLKLLSPDNLSCLVERFSPQIFTCNRLLQRTAADYGKFDPGRGLRVLVAGLGSIGSNLIPFLESVGVTEFRLVDSDVLLIENIGRHLLGINDACKKKTEAVRDYLQRKNPLTVVHTRENRIVPLVLQEPKFLSDCDYYFFCTGDINSETWLAHNLHLNDLNRPAFFIWVEPYLAGGHCLYFDGNDEIDWDILFDDHRFIYNVISNEVHKVSDFIKREAGCQVTYLPYSGSILKLFLAAMFPKILEVFRQRGRTRCFSWIGDLAVLQAMNIKISRHAENVDSFSLVERPIC